MSKSTKPKNKLLAALPIKAFQPLRPKFERIDLHVGDRLYDPGDDFTHVYFVESGIIAMLVIADQDSTLQCCMVGSEGMVGLPVFFGIKTAANRAVVQCPGTALRMKTTDFRNECADGDGWSSMMHQFAYKTLTQISLTAACNRFHGLDGRLARWLLMTRHRLGSDEFNITQEFMSYMLGVRREAISKAAGSFQDRSLIRYSRGNFSILDPKGLEAIACNCYQFFVTP